MNIKTLHKKANEAMQKAIEKVIKEHKEKKLPLVVWEDEKVVFKEVK